MDSAAVVQLNDLYEAVKVIESAKKDLLAKIAVQRVLRDDSSGGRGVTVDGNRKTPPKRAKKIQSVLKGGGEGNKKMKRSGGARGGGTTFHETVMDGGGDESPPFTMEDGPAVGGDGGDSPPFTVDSSGGASPPFTVDGNEGGESPPFTADDMDVEEGESPPYTAGMDGESDNTATKAPAPAFPTGAIPKRKKKTKRRPVPPLLPPSMPPVITGVEAQLFPPNLGTHVLTTDWNSLTAAEPLTLPLPDYNHDGILRATSSNTLAIEFTTPANSSRFCLSIAGDNKDPEKVFDHTLLHVNPRQYWKDGMMLLNDCQGYNTWGRAVTAQLEMFPVVFGVKSAVMVVQVREEGFDLFLQGRKGEFDGGESRMVKGIDGLMHCFRFEHRSKLPDGEKLWLQFLTKADDRAGESQNWTVHKIWWGKKELLADVNPDGSVPGVNVQQQLHPRKLFISGLDRGDGSAGFLERQQAVMEREFQKYGNKQTGVEVEMRGGGSYALVTLADEEMTDRAMMEMRDKYERMTRANKTQREIIEDRKKKEEEDAERALHTW